MSANVAPGAMADPLFRWPREIADLELQDKRHRRGTEGLRFLMIDDVAAGEVNPLLSPNQHRIIAHILSDYRVGEPWARKTVADMCREMEMASPNFYRAVKPLRDAGLVIKVSSTVWQINPHYGWRGSKKDWELARKETKKYDLSKFGGVS